MATSRLLILAFAVCFLSVVQARQVLAASNVTVPDCPVNLPQTVTNVPGIEPSLSLKGAGTVNYTCNEGQPLTYWWTLANLTKPGSDDYTGKFYYDEFERPTIVLSWKGGPERKILMDKAVTQVPSPEPDTLEWERWRVLEDSGTVGPPYAYIERTDTYRGHQPYKCGMPTKEIYYKAVYNFYSCNLAPIAPIVIPPPAAAPITPSEAPVPALVPTEAPTPAGTPEPAAAPTPRPFVVSGPSPADASPTPVKPPVIKPTVDAPAPAPSSGVAATIMSAVVVTVAAAIV